MPKVSISHKCTLPAKEAFSKIKTFFENDPDIRRFDPKMTCEFLDAKMTGKATGSQFKADISVTEEKTSSLVSVMIDLPLLMTPFKGKVQEIIQKKLDKYLV